MLLLSLERISMPVPDVPSPVHDTSSPEIVESLTPFSANAVPGMSVITKESADRLSPEIPLNTAPPPLLLKSLPMYWFPRPRLDSA